MFMALQEAIYAHKVQSCRSEDCNRFKTHLECLKLG